jgi:cytochrome c oxidase subunit 4
MSTITDLDGTGDYGEDEHDPVAELHKHHTDMFYVRIAIALAILTALETSTYWFDFGPFFMPALLTMMSIKFVMVVLFFMHLRFDSKWFNMVFWVGIGLALIVYTVALATFHFFEQA